MLEILHPTDFSQNANDALRFAAGMSYIEPCRVHIMHSYRLLETLKMKGNGPLSVKKGWDEHTQKRFCKLRNSYLVDCPKEILFRADVGFPGDTITSYVDHNKIDLVVMGSSGESKWTRIFGSTTKTVVDNVKCPVLIVPSGMYYQGFSRVLLAYDFEKIRNQRTFQMLIELITGSSGSLEVLNVNNSKIADQDELDGRPFILDQYLDTIPHTYTFTKHQSISGGINHHVKTSHPNLFVLIKRRHKLFEQLIKRSVTHEVLEAAKVPVMVLHE